MSNSLGCFSLFYNKDCWKVLFEEAVNPVFRKFSIESEILYLSSKRGDHVKVFLKKEYFTETFLNFVEEYFKNFFHKYPSPEISFIQGRHVFHNIPNNSLQYTFPDFYPHESEELFDFAVSMSSITYYYLSKERFSPNLQLFLFVLQVGIIAKCLADLDEDIVRLFKQQYENYHYHNTEFSLEPEVLEKNFAQLKRFLTKNLSSVLSLPSPHPYQQFDIAIKNVFLNNRQISIFEKLDFCIKTICYHLDISDVKKLLFRFLFYHSVREMSLVSR